MDVSSEVGRSQAILVIPSANRINVAEVVERNMVSSMKEADWFTGFPHSGDRLPLEAYSRFTGALARTRYTLFTMTGS